MKIAVYTIAKNEEKFAKRWADTSVDADYRVVLDTGSSDRTIEILKDHQVSVESAVIDPWRFDEARNKALVLIPHDVDVCVVLDLDEVLTPNWRAAIEKAWGPDVTMLRCPFVAQWNEDGKTPEQWVYGHRAHARHAYFWKYAIHELLRPHSRHVESRTDDFAIHHRPDSSQAKSSYLPMLEKMAQMEPDESRYARYLATEYYDRGEYDRAMKEFQRYLSLSSANDPSERSFVLQVMHTVRTFQGASRDERVHLAFRAAIESPHEREPWVLLAQEMAEIGNWPNCLAASINALRNNDPITSYRVKPDAWSGLPERLLQQAAQALEIPQHQLRKMQEIVTRREAQL